MTAAGERQQEGGPTEPGAVRETLDFHLTGVLRGRTSIAWFLSWWQRAAATGLLDPLTAEADPRGRKAVDLCGAAVDERRHAKIDDEDFLDFLLLAREALRD